MQKALSVIVPVLNAAPFLKECVDSIICQTYKDFEIIFVDGGSTDGTLDILSSYQKIDERVAVLHSQIRSYGYQMNMGIKKASGEYIGIVEADDFIDSTMFESMLKFVIEKPDFVKESYYQYSIKTGERIVEPFVVNRRGIPTDELVVLTDKSHMIDLNHIWSAIYKRSFLIDNNIWFNETPGASYQDTSFSVLVDLLAETAVFSSGVHYYYRIDNENSSVKSLGKYKCVVDEFQFIHNELEKRKMLKKHLSLIEKHKVGIYYWNYSRLSAEERYLFIDAIKEELLDLNSCSEELCLNDYEKNLIYLMLKNDSSEIEAYKKAYYELVNVLKKHKRIVLFGAGRYGENVLLLQRVYGLNTIIAVVDNDKNKQGCRIGHYTIESPDIYLKSNEDNVYLIANKKHAEDIKNQIKGNRILEDNIVRIRSTYEFYDIISMYEVK